MLVDNHTYNCNNNSNIIKFATTTKSVRCDLSLACPQVPLGTRLTSDISWRKAVCILSLLVPQTSVLPMHTAGEVLLPIAKPENTNAI